MTQEEELYWRNQPEWMVNLEMERRLKEYFESPAFQKKLKYREMVKARNEKTRQANFEKSIEELKQAI